MTASHLQRVDRHGDELFGRLTRVSYMTRRISDEQLLSELHRDCAPMLHCYALRLTNGDHHRAEEAVQEAFSRAWHRPRVLDPARGSARSWLITTVRNILIDEFRTPRMQRHIDDSTLTERHSPLDEIDQMLTATLVADALAALSSPHRDVIVRCFYGGSPVAEVAAALDIPVGTAKTRLFYGLRALRAALQERGLET